MAQMQKRVLMACAGVILCGFCVGLLRIADFGADPYTVFSLGLANLFHTSYGVAFTVVTACLLVVALFADRHFLGVATVVNLLGTGYVADGTYGVLSRVAAFSAMPERVFLLIAALVVLCLAPSLYFTADIGVSGYDAMSLILSKKTRWQFRLCRIGTDLICVVVGCLAGAHAGVGTVVTAFCMGPVIQFFNDRVARPFLYGAS